MYGQQFVPNQMYGQPNVMPYTSGVLPSQVTQSVPTPGNAVMPSYSTAHSSTYSPTMSSPFVPAKQQLQQQQQPPPSSQQQQQSSPPHQAVPPSQQQQQALALQAPHLHASQLPPHSRLMPAQQQAQPLPPPQQQQTTPQSLQQLQQQQQQSAAQSLQQTQQPHLSVAPWQQQQQPTSQSQSSQSQQPPSQQSQQQQPSHPPRQRTIDVGEVSKVIHMRNVTPDVTQLSIQNLAQNFGNITHIVMLRQMNQVLVEMESVKSAQQLVDFFRDPGYAEVDGRRVYIRYSNHQNLTATHHVSRTLLVSMFNTQYDVSTAAHITPEIVYQIFANYGAVQKIVVLPKNDSSQWNYNRVQALVQFNTRETAEHVKNILQGQPVTLGDTIAFTLDIQYSRMDEIRTTNPLTSLIVDENGNTHRPLPQQHQQASSQTQPINIPASSLYANAPSAAQQQQQALPTQQQQGGGAAQPQQWS